MKSFVILLIHLTVIAHAILHGTPDEDRLETQNDPRLPSSFPQSKYLTVRQSLIKNYTWIDDTGSSHMEVLPNWEIWAKAVYWYETRYPNSSCPQTPQGIATLCDWALMVPCLFGNMSHPPRTIYVHSLFLSHFIESTFNFMDPTWRFVLITSGSDQTIPRNIGDVRYRSHPMRGFSTEEDGGEYFQRLINSPKLIHWFAENHDVTHPKLSTLPTGFSYEDENSYFNDFHPFTIPILERPLKVMVSDRVREGRGQWELRATVLELCKQNPTWCLTPFDGAQAQEGVSHKDFVDHLVSVPFIACVHGGGIDPSPKAFESILAGTIPIIQHSTSDDAYQHFPVVFVKEWTDLFQNPNATQLLSKWARELAPYYEEGSWLRKLVLERLTTKYWFQDIIMTKYYQGMNMTDLPYVEGSGGGDRTRRKALKQRHTRRYLRAIG